MPKVKRHPRSCKYCVFCKYWSGDADLRLVNSVVGYEFEMYSDGRCTMNNCVKRSSVPGCNKFEPSYEASKLL